MSATDELQAMLDERGVEYRFNEITKVFEWHFEGTDGDGSAHATEVQGGINIIACSLTPEQAIAATLGREPDDAAMAKLHDQMNAAMLEYEMAQGIEKRDGDGAIVVPWVLKMHALLEEAATLGSCNCSNNCTNGERTGTCHADETDRIECGEIIGGRHYDIHIMECSACGGTYEHVFGDYEYCPHCRSRVVEVNA